MLKRSTHLLARSLAALLAIVTILLALLVWRLASGPVSLKFLDSYLAAFLSEAVPGYRWSFDETLLDWRDLRPALEVTVTGVRVRDEAGNLVARVPRLDLGLSARGLFEGKLVPLRVVLQGPWITLIRGEDGRFGLGIAVPEPGAQGAAEPSNRFSDLTGRVFTALSSTPEANGALLQSFAIRDAQVVYRDARLGTVWRARQAGFEFERAVDGGILGEGAANIEIDKQVWALGLSGRFDPMLLETRVDVAFADVEPFHLAQENEGLKSLDRFRLPVSGTVGLVLGQTGALRSVRAKMVGGPGHLLAPEVEGGVVPLERLAVDLNYDTVVKILSVHSFSMRDEGWRLGARGQVDLAGDSPAVRLSGSITDLPTERFKRLWPEQLATGSRRWFLDNMADGIIDRAEIEADIPAGVIGVGPLPDEALRLTMKFRDVTAHYMRPMPPLQAARGEGLLTGRNFTVNVEEATVLERLTVSEGTVEITDLHLPDKPAAVGLVLRGTAADTLRLIDHEPLQYPTKFGIDPDKIDGVAATRLRLDLLLAKQTNLEDINFAAAANLQNIRIPGVLNGTALDDGEFLLQVNRAGLEANGTAQFGDVPADIRWRQAFGAPPDTLSSTFDVNTSADETQLAALGFPTVGLVEGPAKLAIQMWGNGAKIVHGKLQGDLTGAVLIADPLSWRKPAGEKAEITFDFSLPDDDGNAGKLSDIRLTGDEIAVAGNIVLAAGGPPASITLDRLQLGPENNLSGRAIFAPDGYYQITARGVSADIAAPLAELLQPDDKAKDTENLPYRLDAEIDRLHIGQGVKLQDVSATGEFDGKTFQVLAARGNFRPDAPLAVNLTPIDGERHLTLTSQDAGLSLKALDLLREGVGGSLRFDAVFRDKTPRDKPGNPPMDGQVNIKGIKIRNTPILARILTVGSLTGMRDLLTGSGISFDRVIVPFSYRDAMIAFTDAYASGSALGITANGTFDPARDRFDLKGTVIPAYTLNSVFGKLPILGQVLTGGKNEGVFAMNYTLSGPSENPKIGVNPLSALTPGFLRRIFDIGDAIPGAASPDATPAEAQTAPAAPSPTESEAIDAPR